MLFIYPLVIVVFDHCSLISIYQGKVCWAHKLFIRKTYLNVPIVFVLFHFAEIRLLLLCLHGCQASSDTGHIWGHAFMLNIAEEKNRNTTGYLPPAKKSEGQDFNLTVQVTSVYFLILYTPSLFLHNVCQYDTRSLLASGHTDVVCLCDH